MINKSRSNLLSLQSHQFYDQRMTERDVKNYLEKIYKVKVMHVRSVARDAKFKRSGIDFENFKDYQVDYEYIKDGRDYMSDLIKDGEDYRMAYVQLSKDTKFEFPDLFPQEKLDEEREQHEKIQETDKNRQEEFEKHYQKMKDVPSWFGGL